MCANNHMVNLGFTDKRYPAGTHMCCIYSDEQEASDNLLKFLLKGIEEKEQVLYAHDEHKPTMILDKLKESGIDIEAAVKAGHLTIDATSNLHYKGGEFVPERMLGLIKESYDNAISADYSGARGTGEMLFGTRDIKGIERLMEYESRINILTKTHPYSVVCMYDANAFDGSAILECLKVHPYMIVKGNVIMNPYYIPPEDYLKNNKP